MYCNCIGRQPWDEVRVVCLLLHVMRQRDTNFCDGGTKRLPSVMVRKLRQSINFSRDVASFVRCVR
jgi:hypothetical protein